MKFEQNFSVLGIDPREIIGKLLIVALLIISNSCKTP